MIPIDGPGVSLLAPHTRFEAEPLVAPKDAAPKDAAGGVLFEDLLKNVVGTANDSIQQAEAAGKAFAAGTRDDIHGTMLALSKADIELRMAGNIRNKISEAFYELLSMKT